MVGELFSRGVLLPVFFNIARSVLVQFLSRFSSIRFVSAQMVPPYSYINKTTAGNKSRSYIYVLFIFRCNDVVPGRETRLQNHKLIK